MLSFPLVVLLRNVLLKQRSLTLRSGNKITYFRPWGRHYCSHISDNNNNCKKVTIERTISLQDVNNFSQLTSDFNSIHTNSSRPIVHGAFLNGIVSGVIGTKLPGHGTIVISQFLKFPKPCYVGDTVIISVTLEDVRKIISCSYSVVNKSDGSVVLEGNAKLIKKQ